MRLLVSPLFSMGKVEPLKHFLRTTAYTQLLVSCEWQLHVRGYHRDIDKNAADIYDPTDSLHESDNEGTQNSKKYLFNKLMRLLQIHRLFATEM